MQRRKFGREFKIEAVRLIKDRGVSVAQASRDLDVHENVLRKWVRDFAVDPGQAVPGHGQVKPEQLEIEKLRGAASSPSHRIRRSRLDADRDQCCAPFDVRDLGRIPAPAVNLQKLRTLHLRPIRMMI
jgi:transposase